MSRTWLLSSVRDFLVLELVDELVEGDRPGDVSNRRAVDGRSDLQLHRPPPRARPRRSGEAAGGAGVPATAVSVTGNAKALPAPEVLPKSAGSAPAARSSRRVARSTGLGFDLRDDLAGVVLCSERGRIERLRRLEIADRDDFHVECSDHDHNDRHKPADDPARDGRRRSGAPAVVVVIFARCSFAVMSRSADQMFEEGRGRVARAHR